MYRLGGGSAADHSVVRPGVVRPGVAAGSHFPGKPRPPGYRDPASMVRPGHCPYYSDLFGLFSSVTLAAHVLKAGNTIPFRSTSWYSNSLPTFSDAIALVRQRLWFPWVSFPMSPSPPDMVIIPRLLQSRLVDTACYAASMCKVEV